MSARRSARSPSERRIRRSLDRILEQNVLCAVATVGPRGHAHVHVCYFAAAPDLELFFISDARSRHATNLRRHPSAAIAVFSSEQRWGGRDRGAQLFGHCAPVAPGAKERARRIYEARFPELATNPTVQGLAFYRFVTRQATVLDEREFGDAVLVELSMARRAIRQPRQVTRR